MAVRGLTLRRRQAVQGLVVQPVASTAKDVLHPHISLIPKPYTDGAIDTGNAGDISWLDSGSDALLTARDESRFNLLTHNVYVTVPLVAASVDTFVFTALGHAVEVVGATYLSTIAGTDGGAVTVDLRKVTNDTALPGAAAGANVLELFTAALSLKTAANAVAAATLTATAADLRLAVGNKLAINLIGTMTAVVGTLVIALRPIVAYTES
jgi:hypothetical protein